MSDRFFVIVGLSYVVALLILIGGGWFLYEAFLDLNTAALPDSKAAENMIQAVTNMMIGAAAWVFTTATMLITGRISASASRAGAEHALAQPGEKL